MKFKVTPLQAQAQVSTCYVIRTYMIYLLYTDIALRLFNIAMEHHHFNRYIIYFVLWLIFQFAMLNNQRVYNIYIFIHIYTYIHLSIMHFFPWVEPPQLCAMFLCAAIGRDQNILATKERQQRFAEYAWGHRACLELRC